MAPMAQFWSHFGALLMTFWRLVEFVKIDAPLKRNHTFLGSGGYQLGTFSLLFRGLDSRCVFLCIFMDLEPIRVPNGSQMGSQRAPLGYLWGSF